MGFRRSPVDSPHKGQWRRALMFSFMYAWANDLVNSGDADDLRRHVADYDIFVMHCLLTLSTDANHNRSFPLLFAKHVQNPACINF